MADVNVSFIRGNNQKITETPITDGQILFNTERSTLEMDSDGQRKKYGGGAAAVKMTKAQYDQLTDEEKQDGTIRRLTDVDPIIARASSIEFNHTNIDMDAENVQDAIVELNETKQNKTDNNLTTTNKTIVGAINQLNENLTEYAKIIDGKIYGYNSETQQYDKEISMGTPNFSKKLHTFDASNLTYTATKNCFLYGVVVTSSAGNKDDILINDTAICKIGYIGNNQRTTDLKLCERLKSGDTVTLPSLSAVINWTYSKIYILEEI